MNTLMTEPGCYVDGTCGLRTSTLKALRIAYGFGAVTHKQWQQWGNRMVNARYNEQLDVDYGLRIVDALNETNQDPDYYWFWEAGDLFYGSLED